MSLTEEVAPDRITAVDSDGWVYDVNTGEVLGRADASEQTRLDSTEAVDWALELKSKLEGDRAALVARLKALEKNMRAKIADYDRRLAWWDWRFGGEVIAFARSILTGKSRTARFTWGSVSFRKTPPKHEIVDMAAAVAFVREWKPEEVKVVTSVGIKGILAAAEAAEQATGEPEVLPFVKEWDEGESVTISTGINAEDVR